MVALTVFASVSLVCGAYFFVALTFSRQFLWFMALSFRLFGSLVLAHWRQSFSAKRSGTQESPGQIFFRSVVSKTSRRTPFLLRDPGIHQKFDAGKA